MSRRKTTRPWKEGSNGVRKNGREQTGKYEKAREREAKGKWKGRDRGRRGSEGRWKGDVGVGERGRAGDDVSVPTSRNEGTGGNWAQATRSLIHALRNDSKLLCVALDAVRPRPCAATRWIKVSDRPPTATQWGAISLRPTENASKRLLFNEARFSPRRLSNRNWSTFCSLPFHRTKCRTAARWKWGGMKCDTSGENVVVDCYWWIHGVCY